MEYKKLKNIALVTMGQSPKSESYNKHRIGLPFFQGNADFGEIHPNIKMWCSEPKKIANPGDILISVRAPIGAVNITQYKCCIGRGLASISIENSITRDYIYRLLKSEKQILISKGTGSTFKAINKGILEDINVPVVSLQQMSLIVLLLKKAEDSIQYKKNELTKLNELIKARFVEMFGDPICNSQKRPTVSFINVVKLQRGFDLPVKKRNSEGNIPVFGSNGILGYHTEFKAQKGIITGRSGTIGQVYREQGKFWPLNTSLFSINTHGNNIIYLQFLLQMFHLERFYNGAGVPTLNRNDVHRQKIIDVPVNEQNEFANFVQQVDKSKVAVQKSLEETQTLFDSLMQKYFG